MVGGEAGYGISTMGAMFARICTRAGLFAHGYGEYPSLIRGGHNTAMVRVGQNPTLSHSETVDILLALNKETLDLHLSRMAEDGVVIYDGEAVQWDWAQEATQGRFSPELRVVSVPLARITKDLAVDRVMRNTVALGASLAVFGFEFAHMQAILERTFARKGQEVVDHNVKVAKAGFDFIQNTFGKTYPLARGGKAPFERTMQPAANAHARILLSGNEAIALGALKAGVKFMSAYPMTPVTSIMQVLAGWGTKYDLVMKQTEDEIAAVNMAIGASYMGVRAMTATAGGGFSLMVEALGMAAITETPLVVVEGTRPGPSTGLPTWTDQGDLRFVMHASQGEFPRIVVMPGDAEECFWMTAKAFNWADRYQMLALVVTDKYLGESIHTCEPYSDRQQGDSEAYRIDRGALLTPQAAAEIPAGTYLRYAFTDNGVSPRALPGYANCIHTASTDEHREDGDLDESSENRKKMVDKRARKLAFFVEALPEHEAIELHGPQEADLTLVGWGSTKGPILEAIRELNRNDGNDGAADDATAGQTPRRARVNFLQIKMALPFPAAAAERELKRARKILVIENNATAQMASILREYTGIALTDCHLRYDGRPISSAEVAKAALLRLPSDPQ